VIEVCLFVISDRKRAGKFINEILKPEDPSRFAFPAVWHIFNIPGPNGQIHHMKQTILVTRPLFSDIVDRLREHFEVVVNEGPRFTPEQLKEALKDKDGVLIAGGEKIDGSILEGLTRLKALCVSAAGYNNIDVDALTRAGVIGTNSPGPADETVADFAWGLMIATARKLVEGARWVEEGQWKSAAGSRFFGTNVSDATLGIIGMGRIGQAIARRAAGFRNPVLYHNRNRLDSGIEQECRAAYVSKEQLLRESDLVMLALPYTPGNHHLIAKEELQLMRPTTMLFNIARGGLIDEVALAQALQSRQIAGAGLDVFESEPSIHPGLIGLPNVVLTPHIAGATADTQHGLAAMAAGNLIAILRNGPGAAAPGSVFNPEVLNGTSKK
jgi:gluconate 2-dehydrogenase